MAVDPLNLILHITASTGNSVIVSSTEFSPNVSTTSSAANIIVVSPAVPPMVINTGIQPYAISSSFALVAQRALTSTGQIDSASVAISASFATSASHAPFQVSASYATSASWAPVQITASFATSASFAPQLPVATASFATSASWAPVQVSASYAISASFAQVALSANSASYAPQLPVVSSSYAVSSSWAPQLAVISASFAQIATSASWAPFQVSSSYATTASYAPFQPSASYAVSSSAAQLAISSSYANTAGSATSASYVPAPISASYSLTASYAANAGNGTANSASYSLTSSYAQVAQTVLTVPISSSYALSASYAPSLSSSYALTASYALNGGTGGSSNGVFGGNFSGSFSGSLFGSLNADTAFVSGALAVGIKTVEVNSIAQFHKKQNVQTMLFVSNDGGVQAQASIRTGLVPTDATQQYTAMGTLGGAFPTVGALKSGSAYLEGSSTNLVISNTSPTEPIVFATGPSRAERLRIDVAGNTIATGLLSGSHKGDGSQLTGLVSSSYAFSASYAPQQVQISASYAGTASILLGSIQTASFAISASYAPGNPSISASYAAKSTLADTATSASYALSASWAPSTAQISSSYATTSSATTQTVFQNFAVNGPPNLQVASVDGTQAGIIDIYGKPAGTFGGISTLRFFPSGSTTAGLGLWEIFSLAANFIQQPRAGNVEFYNVGTLSPAFIIDSSSRMGIGTGYSQPFKAGLTIAGPSPVQPIMILTASAGQTGDVFQIIAGTTVKVKIDSAYNLSANLIGSASSATSASYALSASYSPNLPTASYALTASYAPQITQVSGSYAITSSFAVSASFAPQLPVVSSSYALSASWAPGSGASISSSYALTASYAPQLPVVSASYAGTASILLGSVVSASFAQNTPHPTIWVTGSYTASLTDAIIVVSGSSTTASIYLPATPVFAGQSYLVRVAGNNGWPVIVIPSGSETIDGFTSIVLTTSRATVALTSNGRNEWMAAGSGSYSATSLTSASYALSASWAPGSGASISSSYALTASYALNGGGGASITSSYALTIPRTTVKTTTGSYTASVSDNIIMSNSPSSTASIYLPAASANSGFSLLIRKYDSSAYPVLVFPNGSDKIDAFTGISLTNQYAAIALTSDGVSSWIAGGSASYSSPVSSVTSSFAFTASYATSVNKDNLTTIVSDYTASINDVNIICNVASGSLKVYLPDATIYSKWQYKIKLVKHSTNTVTVVASGSQQIDESSTITLNQRNETLGFVSDGLTWWVF